MKYGYGVDVGGTAVKIGFFDEEGTLLDKWSVDSRDPERPIPRNISELIRRDMERRPLSREDYLGIGVGVPGQVWRDDTVSAVNLGWDHAPVLRELVSGTGLKVIGGNDADLAAMGEFHYGSGRSATETMVMITLGTGVGGGIIVDGRPIKSAHQASGEIGHIPMNPSETLVCGCGNRGCLEQYASATGCARLAREALGACADPSSLRSLESVDAKAVWDAVSAGDALAGRIAGTYCEYLAQGLATVANIIDPEIIVIGGGVSRAGQILIDMVSGPYRRMAFNACKDTPIVLASLGNDAGIYGAMAAVLAN